MKPAFRLPRPLVLAGAAAALAGHTAAAQMPQNSAGFATNVAPATSAIPYADVADLVIASPIIVRATVGLGYIIMTAAVLGFLGIGVPPPTPDGKIRVVEIVGLDQSFHGLTAGAASVTVTLTGSPLGAVTCTAS